MNKNSINQKKFPFIKRKVYIDQKRNKISICNQALFSRNEVEIAIESISENSERVQKKSIGWLFTAIVLSGYFLAYFSTWFWNPPTNYGDMAWHIIGQLFLLSTTVYFSWKYFNQSYDLTLYSNKHTDQILFALHKNNPDKDSFSKFTETLHDTIRDSNQRKTINEILANIPTHILVDEFSTSYISELFSRDVDISSMLIFLTKKVEVLKNR